MTIARDVRIAALGAIAAAAPAVALWGFTVDDALIPARYAAHLARGLGYRFNAAGPITDGVTPLGWAYLLAPFATRGALAALAAAKVLGLLSWLGAAAALALAVDRAGARPARFAALLLVASSAPLAAWSVAGLETGCVTALATVAIAARAVAGPRAATASAACIGVCAGLRPELLPWAIVVTAAPADPERPRSIPWRRLGRVALGAAPFAVVALIRIIAFGRPFPLAALAKQPDAELGAKYALACFLLTGPLALLAPLTWRRLEPYARWLLASVAVHFVAVALVGGDWMPLSRLVVPVLPAVALAAAHLAAASSAPLALARLVLGLSGELFVLLRMGPVAARVGRDRLAVIDELRPALERAQVVAALDIGWVGAATDANVLDLAGVTDPTIAALPGGHTTKHIAPTVLEERRADTVVLLIADQASLATPWTETRFARAIENYIAGFPGVGEAFQPVATSHPEHVRYVVLRRALVADARALTE